MPARPDEALARLRDGNARFTRPVANATPFATILTCVDPRVAPEVVFDEGLGQMFVVRVAGNVAGELQLSSIQLSVANGGELVVVMGHTDCKAIPAERVRDNVIEQAKTVRRAVPDAHVVGAIYDVASGDVEFLD